jgi:hypothetical protein
MGMGLEEEPGRLDINLTEDTPPYMKWNSPFLGTGLNIALLKVVGGAVMEPHWVRRWVIGSGF